MLPDSDEEWLRAMAFGAGEDVIITNPPSPVAMHAGGPIHAAPITTVAETPLVGEEERVGAGPSERVRKRKGRDGVRGDKGKKHKSKTHSQKSGSTSRYRSFALDDQFVQKSYEEYVADPIAASVHCMLHLQDLANEEKRRCELRVAEAQAELQLTRRNLDMATLSLATVRTTLKVVEKQRDDLMLRGGELEERIAELEVARKDAEMEIERLGRKVEELEEKLRNAPTAAESSNSQVRVQELEQALAQSNERVQKTAQLALSMKDKGFKQGFNLALQQVMVVNPSMDRFSAVLQPNHDVDDGKIVRVDPATKAKTAVFP